MTAVQLDLTLGLEAFQAKVAAAEGMLLRLKSKADSGLSLKTFLDTSSLADQLASAQKALSSGNTTIKVGTDFYKTGSQYAISATKLKAQVIDPIQQKVNSSRQYTIKIGTELTFDQSSLRQIEQVVSKAKASLQAAQRGTGAVREKLTQLTQVPSEGGLDAAALRRLQTAAGQAGIKTSSTGARELRNELRDAFSQASDDAIEGLAKGLVSGSTQVIDATTQTGKALIKALKKTLGIASPSKETRKLGGFSADGFGQGFVQGMVTWERQMAQSIRQAVGNAWRDGLKRDATARGALSEMGRDAAQVISTSLGKALRQGVASSIAPALKGGILGATGGAATGGLVGGLGAAGSAIKSAVMPSMLTFGYGSVPQKLGMLGHGAASLASGGASDAFNTFLQNSVDTVLQAALSTGGQGALVGAAGVAGVAGVAGLARGATGSLIGQAIEAVKDRVMGGGAKAAIEQAEQLQASSGTLAQSGAQPQAMDTLNRSMERFKVQLTEGQQNLLEYALQLDNTDVGTFGEKWSDLGGKLSRKMELSAEQLTALAKEIETNPVLDDIDSYGDDLGKSAERIAINIKKKFADLTRQLEASTAAQAAQGISRQLVGDALQQSAALAQSGGTSGAVSAPIENANSMFSALKQGTAMVAKALVSFAQELTPGRIQERILNIAWNIDQAAEEFAVAKRNTQVLAGKIRNTWDAFSNDVRPQLLPPQPVPGTGLVREQNMQLGNVVGRTAFDFLGQPYGVDGGRIGPADLDQSRGYLEQTRKALEPIAGKPGEWRIVDEVNGIWQRIKTNSELAEERLRLIAENMTQAAQQSQQSGYRTWTDRAGVGTFNPFDQAFYRPTQPPQQPPRYSDAGSGAFGRIGSRDGRDVFGPTGGGGGFSFGGNRFGTPSPGGALARRNVPVELFTSFKDAERLLSVVEQRLAAVGRAFDTLGVKSKIQVDQDVRQLAVSLRAVELAFQKGEVGARDFIASIYGMQREMAGLGGKSAEIQNLAQAFENLGIQSRAAVGAIQDQRNLDLQFIEQALGPNSSETIRAQNARDIQQMDRANSLVRTAQSASGFGGFRGREIGNDVLNQAQQRSVLANAVREMREYQQTLKRTTANSETYDRVQKALNTEIREAERAWRVLNGRASDGERIAVAARNAWGTILDDFQNLVPQLLVFAVAYNLILQRVMGTPGAVIQAAAAFDRLETSISAYLSATRGMGDTSAVIGELRDVALDLGIGFEKAASSYLRFAAATQGTPLQGQEVDIARTLATAGRNQGLSGEQIDRASVALTQILSKGKVQSEELRGQLAEQLPGALQVAARAFGVTTKELYRMVEAGQIAGDEFVGRFIQQLKAEGASANQLAGNFASVTEQLGSSFQSLTAAAGQPLLAPLTLSLQALNAVVKTLIPVAPVVTGLFLVLGATALRSALGVKSLSAEALGLIRNLFGARDAAEGYTAGMVKLAGVARVAATVLATVGRAAVIGLAIEGMAGAIRYLKGEVGALGDELKKVNKIAEGGQGGGLNGVQQLLGRLNVAQNFSDSATLFDAAKIEESSDKATKKITENQKKIAASIKEVNRIDRELYSARVQRDQAEANQDEEGAKRSIERIKELEKARNNVRFTFAPEDAQIQLGALQAAEQAIEKVIERNKALGSSADAAINQRQLDRLRQTREEFERVAKAAGLLDRSILKIQSLGALQSRLKANQEILGGLDVNSQGYRDQQLLVSGAQQAVNDQQLLPQERALKTQESVLRRMTTELKVQENAQRIKLSLLENERKVLEASLSLEQSRSRLREAVAQRRVDIANAVDAPEEALAAEVQLRRVREAGQAKELRMQGQILSKDRERVGIETDLQKQQIRLQTEQLKIDKQMLMVERLKLEAAAKTEGVSKDLVRAYYLQMGQIDKTVKATDKLVGQEGALLQSVEKRGAAELAALGIRQQELDVQMQIIQANGLTDQQVKQINAAKQDIANKEAAALAAIEAANTALQQAQQAIEGRLDAVRATVEAERERARVIQESAQSEMALVDRLLELQNGLGDGGFFERMSKASLLGANSEQQAFDLAARRMDLQRQIQEQQLRQKRLELNLKKQELEAEKALNTLKLKGLRIANEEAKTKLRTSLESARLTLAALGDKATPAQREQLQQITRAQTSLGGYNATGTGNSVDVGIASDLEQSRLLNEQGKLITEWEADLNRVYGERESALRDSISGEERMLAIQQRLFELDAARWFSEFLDKSTQLGRTLSVVSTGISEFRGTVAQAFGEAITNGANAADAVADAGQALAGKIVTGLVDEMILKPMENRFLQGMGQLFGVKPPQSDQAATASNTAQTKQSVDAVNSSVQGLQTTIRDGAAAVVTAINNIPKPTMATPTYRAPSNPGASGIASAMAGARAVGGIGNMLPGTRGGPNINEGVGYSARRGRNHNGQDLGLDVGDPIHARRGGKVIDAYGSGFGKVGGAVVVRYDDGDQGTYGHVRPGVRPGDAVTAGQRIATVAPDGQNTHLHYELRDGFGKLLNPLNAIRESLRVPVGVRAAAAAAPAVPALPPATMPPLPMAQQVDAVMGPGGKPMPLPVVPFGSDQALGQAGYLPSLDTATSQAWSMLSEELLLTGGTLAEARQAIGQAGQAASRTPSFFGRLNSTLSGVVGLIGSVGMGLAGAQQMKGGGTYNTLMGLSGIFSAAGSITGGVLSKLFRDVSGVQAPSFRAGGGPVQARRPYIVGELGPELIIPETAGTVLPHGATAALLASRQAIGRTSSQAAGGDAFGDSRDALSATASVSRERYVDRILSSGATSSEIKYTRVGSGDLPFITEADMLQATRLAAQEGARMGQQRTLAALRNDPSARRGIGI